MNECPQIEDHEGSEAGIRVVPRVIARPFLGWAFFVRRPVQSKYAAEAAHGPRGLSLFPGKV